MCSESFDGLHALRGAQEPREGVFGHEVVDSLLSVVECVGTRKVRHAQQSLSGLGVQVDLSGGGKQDFQKKSCLFITRHIANPLHEPPVEHRGWWTGCRCCLTWSSAGLGKRPCSPHRPARTRGSPHWTPSAGSPETPADRLGGGEKRKGARRGGKDGSPMSGCIQPGVQNVAVLVFLLYIKSTFYLQEEQYAISFSKNAQCSVHPVLTFVSPLLYCNTNHSNIHSLNY